MRCRRVRELMGAYLYGDLAPDEMMEVRLHTHSCSECREDLAGRGEVVSQLGAAVPRLSDEERQQITWSVKGSVRALDQSRRPLAVRLAPGFALAGVLAVGIGVGAFMGARQAKPPPGPGMQASARPAVKAKVSVREKLPPAVEAPKTATQEKVAARPKEPRSHRSRRAFDPLGLIPTAIGGLGSVHRGAPDPHRDAAAPVPEPPVPVVPDPGAQIDDNQEKLPAPTDANDARTQPSEPGQ